MANSVRFVAGVDDRASKPIRDIHDAWLRLQRDGSQALVAGVAAAASIQAFNLAGQAIHQFSDFLRDSVGAAQADQQSQARLNASLTANVTAWDGNTKAVEAHITANTAAAFADDDLRQSLGTLVAATHDVNAAFDDQAIAIDLARFKNEDLQSATQELVKVEAGNFRSLKSLGIATDDIKTSTEALAAIRKVVAGQSEAFLETDAGKAEALKVATEELSEAFGRFATGPLAQVESGLAKVFNILSGQTADAAAAAGDSWVEQLKKHMNDATQADLQALQKMLTEQLDKSKHTVSLFGIDLPVGNFVGESDAIQRALDEVNQELAILGGSFDDNTDRMKTGSDKAATGVDGDFTRLATTAKSLGNDIDALGGSINGLPTSKTIDIIINTIDPAAANRDRFGEETGTGGFAIPSSSGASDLISSLKGAAADKAAAIAKAKADADAAARKAASDAAAAKRKAEQDARDLAQAQIAAGNDAFDRLSKAAHKYFDDLHAANLKAIDDARKKADAEIEQQKRANQQPVTDAQNALKGLQDARHLQQLKSDLEAAKTETGVDPNQQAADIQTAQNALSDFLVQNAIDQKQAQADTANAALDQQKADQDAAFDAQTAAENDRHEAQVTAFDEGLAELRKYLSKHPAEWAKYTNLVIQTLKAAGLDYKQAGVDNANAYLDGVRAAFGGITSGATTGKGGRQAPAGPTLSTTGIGDMAKLSSGLAYAGSGAVGDVYLDGEKVGAILDRRTGRLAGIYNPMSVSTGSGTR